MNSESAKNGFKTFILTLSVSLILFSVIYYVVTGSSDSSNFQADITEETPLAQNALPTSEEEVKGVATTASAFGELAKKDPQAKPMIASGAVLAGSDTTNQTTQSTSPDTGIVEITLGLVISFILFVLGFYVVFLNPRKLALNSFEKSIFKDLN